MFGNGTTFLQFFIYFLKILISLLISYSQIEYQKNLEKNNLKLFHTLNSSLFKMFSSRNLNRLFVTFSHLKSPNVSSSNVRSFSSSSIQKSQYIDPELAAGTSFATEFIRIDHKKGVRFITLTRESALNSLNHEMVKQLTPIYRAYNSDPTTSTIILRSNPTSKAFCAGGDVVSIVTNKDAQFFKDEYVLDEMIAKLSKPHVSIWNGIVMGGGVGISVHGGFRVATEKALFAMPETGIGFFPDVGGSYMLPRLDNNYGFYLGLTGKRLKGKQIYDAGLATHYVPSEKLEELQNLLVRLDSKSPISVRNCIKHVHSEPKAPIDNIESISKIFDPTVNPTVEKVVQALNEAAKKEEWAKDALTQLKKASPTALKVTYEQLKRGKNLSLEECFAMEYKIAQQMLKEKDFPEGVKALLISKTNNPSWEPKTLEEVKNEDVQKYF